MASPTDSTFNEPTPDSDDLSGTRESGLWLTILHHPDGTRVGESVRLNELHGGLPVAVSRSKPRFVNSTGEVHALEHPRLSRTPIWLRIQNNKLMVSTTRSDLRALVDDQPLRGECEVELKVLSRRGVFIALGGCVLLFLNALKFDPQELAEHDMCGASMAVSEVFATIKRVAPLSTPVLIRGESGVGKELVARAVHRLSQRRERAWVTVNLAAVPISTAASELFGHIRGAFTGADQARPGYFAQADGGSLFLDEIGETASDIQPQLLRALENGEIQPVGGSARTVDVRVITATDADLEALVASGQFRRSLLHRLQTAVINVPPLRERPADIPVLLHYYLRRYLREHRAEYLLTRRLGGPSERAWLRLSLIRRLMRYRFPGNVRELRNVAARMALKSHDRSQASLPADVKEALDLQDGGAVARQTRTRPPSEPPVSQGGIDISPETITATLRDNRWNVTRSARALGVSKNTLTARIREIPGLRLAGELTREDISAAMERVGTDTQELADALEVSAHGLRLRLRELGLR